ncbi:MAG: aminotransferase class I/II-fold pyridoxal phosphate-dependent enzyme [Salinivirgaceae bacterium]|jgi:O-acetylhomoserine/O-acetylserine sulfhydrylase|nr:aminotransferase class I/II-fold pyridoxal phosphate-dependent enzyme [Salinivirgaceae bacterium]
MKFETQQIHAGLATDESTGSRVTPLYQTASYAFKSAEHARALFALETEGNIYTRISNPTNAVLENRIAALEGGKAALAVSSGHAAQLIAIATIAAQGDNIVTSPYLYGGSHNQFKVTLRNFGIEVRFAQNLKPESFNKLIDENTHGIYLETIGNPSFHIPDFEAIANIANIHKIPIIVDNTFGAGGYFCQPIKHGAHIVTHSATKWIGGHGNSMGGIIVDAGTFDWKTERFRLLNTPSAGYQGLTFTTEFDNLAFIARARAELLRDLGSSQSPFNSFLLLQGVETLSLRARRQADNAIKLAKWLELNTNVESVSYPGLPHHPSHKEANKYLRNGYGAVLTFDVKGGANKASQAIDKFKLAGHMANVGDNRTLVLQPATTTHQQLTTEEQKKAEITPAQIRVSIGIEHIDDIINDFERALNT